MVGDGIIRMMKALIAKKYNRDKGTNPFSYFTRIAFNAFRNRIKKEKHIHETHEKYQREFMLMSESFNHLSKNNNINIMKERDRKD
jgi:DNA-directed RNA polymerase specialized sigma24 family protein